MTVFARDLWQRAVSALDSASVLFPKDPDGAASRAYYAAFYAVSALFALEGAVYKSHRALEIAVHRELVSKGRLSQDLGRAYSILHDLRSTADYGGSTHVPRDAASRAIDRAKAILEVVRLSAPTLAESTVSGTPGDPKSQ